MISFLTFLIFGVCACAMVHKLRSEGQPVEVASLFSLFVDSRDQAQVLRLGRPQKMFSLKVLGM